MGLTDIGSERLAGKSYRQIKRIVVAVMGGTVLLLGIVLIVLPGPAFLVIPAGLAILATEFAWAKNLLTKAKGFIPRRKNRTGAGAQEGKQGQGECEVAGKRPDE